ncbi:hypothetical protein DFP72DRAFT_852027 [Ephemerocybe angulata]|uniref:Uncharacterized protein n=1 Tax=Ephemerocybe angulata TaxID=980116 RepID=A0A8H6HP37_9AGAR|nr:hypothetical protein DFP72DRAFT_852027 [Tulosesus angulatus]
MAEHNTWTVRKNLHYLGTQSPSTNLVLKKGDPRSYWLHVFPKRNLDPWKTILDTLNGANIPTCNPLQDSQKSAVAATNNARAALHQAETVIAALGEGNGLAEAKDFVDAHFYMLLECWNDILKWLLYLMLNTPTASDPLTIFTTVRTFYSMISFDGWSHLQEEILDNANTIDYIYLLLHQKDPESGMYWYINCAAGNPTCVILKSLSQCLNWESTTHLLASRFKAMRSGLRMKVVKSLYDRPRMMTFGGARGHDLWDFAIVAYDLATLSLVVSALGNDPEISKKIRRRVCYYIAYAMFVLASDEVEPFANFTPETWCMPIGSIAAIARLVDGHDWLTETNHVTPHSHHRILNLVRGKAECHVFHSPPSSIIGPGAQTHSITPYDDYDYAMMNERTARVRQGTGLEDSGASRWGCVWHKDDHGRATLRQSRICQGRRREDGCMTVVNPKRGWCWDGGSWVTTASPRSRDFVMYVSKEQGAGRLAFIATRRAQYPSALERTTPRREPMAQRRAGRGWTGPPTGAAIRQWSVRVIVGEDCGRGLSQWRVVDSEREDDKMGVVGLDQRVVVGLNGEAYEECGGGATAQGMKKCKGGATTTRASCDGTESGHNGWVPTRDERDRGYHRRLSLPFHPRSLLPFPPSAFFELSYGPRKFVASPEVFQKFWREWGVPLHFRVHIPTEDYSDRGYSTRQNGARLKHPPHTIVCAYSAQRQPLDLAIESRMTLQGHSSSSATIHSMPRLASARSPARPHPVFRKSIRRVKAIPVRPIMPAATPILRKKVYCVKTMPDSTDPQVDDTSRTLARRMNFCRVIAIPPHPRSIPFRSVASMHHPTTTPIRTAVTRGKHISVMTWSFSSHPSPRIHFCCYFVKETPSELALAPPYRESENPHFGRSTFLKPPQYFHLTTIDLECALSPAGGRQVADKNLAASTSPHPRAPGPELNIQCLGSTETGLRHRFSVQGVLAPLFRIQYIPLLLN